MDQTTLDFLEQSNWIEGVTDGDSLDQAVLAWKYLVKQKEITVPVVLKTHKILMLHQHLQPDQKGYFRKIPVYIGGREGLPVFAIREKMEEWVLDAMTSVKVPGKDGKNINLDHIQYEKIHPFVDGNGRTGRMFMNWTRLKAGLPILVIWEQDRFEYYKWFK